MKPNTDDRIQDLFVAWQSKGTTRRDANVFTATNNRVLVWFSCGAASTIAAKYALGKYGPRVEVLYCDTLKYEHPDNLRYIRDIESWLGVTIKVLKSSKFADIYDVFDRQRYLVGVAGAPCTKALKRDVRKDYQRPGDTHIFGFTWEESDRIQEFEDANPDLVCDWILADSGVRKSDCLQQLVQAGIRLPEMYRLGYKNNNCIGCVKGGAGYWNKIRADFPEAFAKMAAQERKIGASILSRKLPDGTKVRMYLDELPPGTGDYKSEPAFDCGPQCELPQ